MQKPGKFKCGFCFRRFKTKRERKEHTKECTR